MRIRAPFSRTAITPELRATRLKRHRIAQYRRWSRTLKSLVPLSAAIFAACYVLSYFGHNLGFGGLAAAAAIASAAGAFLLDRQIEELNFELENPDKPIDPPLDTPPPFDTPSCL